jgi:hypothetical protein
MDDREREDQPRARPSIYERLMPLMYGLIGAASALLLNTLLCNSPFSPAASRSSECKTKTVRTARKEAVAAPRPTRPPAHAGAVTSSPDAVMQEDARERTPDAPRPDAAPSPRRTAAEQVRAAVAPCVRSRARSFRVAVRARPDGKVARVFVARDHGVNARMTACIEKRLADVSLPLPIAMFGYVEWRVRQEDGALSATLIRPHRALRP